MKRTIAIAILMLITNNVTATESAQATKAAELINKDRLQAAIAKNPELEKKLKQIAQEVRK